MEHAFGVGVSECVGDLQADAGDTAVELSAAAPAQRQRQWVRLRVDSQFRARRCALGPTSLSDHVVQILTANILHGVVLNAVAFAESDRGSTSLSDHVVQVLAANVLHGVVLDTVAFAEAEDRHDVLMLQTSRGARFESKSFQMLRVHQCGQQQYLQRHVPSQGLFHGFVHHAHPAAANFSNDPVSADFFGNGSRLYLPIPA